MREHCAHCGQAYGALIKVALVGRNAKGKLVSDEFHRCPPCHKQRGGDDPPKEAPHG